LFWVMRSDNQSDSNKKASNFKLSPIKVKGDGIDVLEEALCRITHQSSLSSGLETISAPSLAPAAKEDKKAADRIAPERLPFLGSKRGAPSCGNYQTECFPLIEKYGRWFFKDGPTFVKPLFLGR